MKIAIQAADLDYDRIDGTRVYLLNMLRRFGALSEDDEFIIYHRKNFNPELSPPELVNYKIKKIFCPFLWTQAGFLRAVRKDNPDVLWMPMHNIPLMRNKKMKTTVTIHDLAFKYFPDHFTKIDLMKLNFLVGMAVKRSDKIIAVSESTKNDILKFYPEIKEQKIKVIYHGFDSNLFKENIPGEESRKILSNFKLQASNFMLYVGAIQPRKNLEILIEAFNLYKGSRCGGLNPFAKFDGNEKIKLVLAGGKAWKWKKVLESAKNSPYSKDIIITGTLPFKDIRILYKSASLFVFPSLYEGFGIPILEAFASETPVISSQNSSLQEVGGRAVKYFESGDCQDLCCKMEEILENENLRKKMIERGIDQLKRFSWDKCASETLDWIKD